MNHLILCGINIHQYVTPSAGFCRCELRFPESSSDLIIIGERVAKEPIFLYFCDITNKCFVAGFNYLVEDDPVRFSILLYLGNDRNIVDKNHLQT